MGFLKRRSRKKEVEALSEKHGAPLIENEDYKDKPNFFKSYSKEFLDKACNEYLSGHYNACIIFSGQAVELSLLFELYLHKTKDEEWTEFIDKWNYAPSLGQLKDLHKRQNNDIISESTIEKSEDLNNLRNAYAHYPNFLIQASRRSPSKEFDRQIRRISNKIGFDVSPYKPHVEPILNKFLKSRKGITLDEAEEMIGSLREFEGLGKSSSVDKLEKLRSERLDSSTDRVAEKRSGE